MNSDVKLKCVSHADLIRLQKDDVALKPLYDLVVDAKNFV